MTNGILTSTELATIFPESSISNHPNPLLSTVKRTVQLGGFSFGRIQSQQAIALLAIVKHYDSNNNYIPGTVSDLTVALYADTNHYIDPTTSDFARVQQNEDGTWPANAVREWDAWVNLFNSPQNIFQIITAQLVAEDSNGAYNNYPSGQTVNI